MFPNIFEEWSNKDIELLESIFISNISRRSVTGRKPIQEFNPHSPLFQSNRSNWSSIANDAFYSDNTPFKVVSVNYLTQKIGEDFKKSPVVINQRVNINAGDVKDIFNRIYGYSLQAPGLDLVNKAYLDFKVGSPLPTKYLENLLKDLKLCPLLSEHRSSQCANFHPIYEDFTEAK